MRIVDIGFSFTRAKSIERRMVSWKVIFPAGARDLSITIWTKKSFAALNITYIGRSELGSLRKKSSGHERRLCDGWLVSSPLTLSRLQLQALTSTPTI